jgi:tripartite-type tricarboxylate transporter receptor subunit TctC
MWSRWTRDAAVIALAVVSIPTSWTQDSYPSKSMRLVVPVAASGGMTGHGGTPAGRETIDRQDATT